MFSSGYTLIEVLVASVSTVILILSVYDMYSNINEMNFHASNKLGVLANARTIEPEFRYYLQSAGLGVPGGTARIREARRNHLSVYFNPDYFTYTSSDYFLPANSVVNVSVQKVEETAANQGLVLLSASGQEIASSLILQSYSSSNSTLALINGQALWIPKGAYVGKTPKIQTLTVANRKLTITTGDSTVTLAEGIESFDVAFLYDPPWEDTNLNGVVDSGEDPPAVWCYDAAEDYPGNYDAGSMQRILDTNLSGEISYDDDQNSDLLIEGATLSGLSDTDGNGRINGVPFDKATLARVWMLLSGKSIFRSQNSAQYLLGRRIVNFNDGRERIVSYVDVPLNNVYTE